MRFPAWLSFRQPGSSADPRPGIIWLMVVPTLLVGLAWLIDAAW